MKTTQLLALREALKDEGLVCEILAVHVEGQLASMHNYTNFNDFSLDDPAVRRAVLERLGFTKTKFLSQYIDPDLGYRVIINGTQMLFLALSTEDRKKALQDRVTARVKALLTESDYAAWRTDFDALFNLEEK